MQLGQAQLGYPTNIHLSGYIPAPVQRDSVAKQALLAFLANAGGALAHQAVGAGAESLGALTPEQTAQQMQAGETARHNVAGERLGQQELGVRSKFSDAEIENMRQRLGLAQETERGQLALGQRHAASTEAGQAETGRHNLATEGESTAKLAQDKALIDATVGHLGAETGQLKSSTAMQQNMQRQMAISNLTHGMDPKSPQTLMLVQAANNVPFNGDEQAFTNQVRQKMQDLAKRQLEGGAGGPIALTAPTPNVADQGGMIQKLMNSWTQPTDMTYGAPTDMERQVNADALHRYLFGGPSRFDEQPPISPAPPYQVPTVR